MQALIRHRWLVPVDPGGAATWVKVLEHLGHSVHVDPVAGVAAVDSVLFRRRVTLYVHGGDARARAALEQELVARLRAAGAGTVPAIGSGDEPAATSDAAITITVDTVARAATVEGARHRPLASWRLARELARALQACGRHPVRQCHVPIDTRELLPARPASVAGPVVRVSIPAGWPVAELVTALYAGLVTYFGGPRQPLSVTAPVPAPGWAGAGSPPVPLPAPAGNGHARSTAATLPGGHGQAGSGPGSAARTPAHSGGGPGHAPSTGTPASTPRPAEAAMAGVATAAPPQPGDLPPAGPVEAFPPEPALAGMDAFEPGPAAGPAPAHDAGLPETGSAPEAEAGPMQEPAAGPAPEVETWPEAASAETAEPEQAAAGAEPPEPPTGREPVDLEAVPEPGHDAPPPAPARSWNARRRRPVMAPGLPAGMPREVLPPGAQMAYAFATTRPGGTVPNRPAFPSAPPLPATGLGATGQRAAGRPGRQPMRAVPSFVTGKEPGSLRPFR